MNIFMLIQAYPSCSGSQSLTADVLQLFSAPALGRKDLERLRGEELEQKPEDSRVPETKGWQGQNRL